MARKRTVAERNEDGDGSDDAGSYVPAAVRLAHLRPPILQTDQLSFPSIVQNKRSRPSTSTQPNTASASPDLDDDDDDDMNGDEDFAEEGGDEGMREMRGDVRRLQNLNQSNARRQEQAMAAAGEGDGGVSAELMSAEVRGSALITAQMFLAWGCLAYRGDCQVSLLADLRYQFE